MDEDKIKEKKLSNKESEDAPIGDDMLNKTGVEILDEKYIKGQFFELLALTNMEVELLLKTIIKLKINWMFFDKKYPQNKIRNEIDSVDRLSISTLNRLCLWSEVINFDLYKNIQKFNALRNKFTHTYEFMLNINMIEIEEYYKQGKYCIEDLIKYIHKLNVKLEKEHPSKIVDM